MTGCSRSCSALAQRLAPRHQAHQLLGRPLPAVEVGHGHAGSHDGDPVADLLDLVHAMGDEDHADAASREVAHDREQAVAGGDVECGGRLVEDEDLGVAHERADDPAGLAIRQRELLDGHVQVDLAAEQLAEHLLRTHGLLARRHARAPRAVGTEPDVVEHRARLGDEDLLEDREDAAALRFARRLDRRDELAVELDLPGVRGVDAAEDLDQRRLAAAVLADERVHLAGPQLERGVANGLGRPERLGDVGDAQQCGGLAVARRPRGHPFASLLGAGGSHRTGAWR